MARKKDTAHQSSDSGKSTRRHGGLGRGLAALIPDSQSENPHSVSRPLDVLFPEHTGSHAPVRGGSQRDLLSPRSSRRTAHTRKGTTTPESEGTGNSTTVVSESSDAFASNQSRNLGSERAHKDSTRKNRVTSAGTRKGAARKSQSDDGAVSRKGEGASPRKGQSRSRLFAEVLEGTPANVSRETSPSAADSPGPDGDHAPKENSGSNNAEAVPRSDAGHAGTGDEKSDLVEVPGATFAEIPTQWIVPNTRQPRSVFDEDDLNELAASIREVGVLQPIVIRPIEITSDTPDTLREYIEEKPEARYELIMGERRLRASEIAEVDTIPAIIRRTQDEDLLRDALLENLHRAQLNPLEEASAYAQLMEDFGATQEELSRRIARSRPQIANTLRLLKLPPAVQRKVASGVISAGHARALLSLPTPDEMELLADRIVAEGLSVRTTEEIARLNKPKPARVQRIRKPQQLSELGRHVAAELSDLCDTRVTVNEGSTKGKIVIEFAGAQDLERIAAVLRAQAR